MNRKALCFISLLLPFASLGHHIRQAGQDPSTVRLSSNLVLLNLVVTDDEQRYVGELRQKDFRVFEDGTEQTIVSFGSQETPFAAAIVMDVSGSMERMARIAFAAARHFADELRGMDVFAVYVFANQVAQVQDFGVSPELDNNVWGIEPEGGTALYDGIQLAVMGLNQRPEKRRAVLVLSDGADTCSRHSLEDCLRSASAASATIYTVNLMDSRYGRRPESLRAAGALRALAKKTGGRYINDPGGSGMYHAFKEIVMELSHQYTLGYIPNPEKLDGKWHRIRVRVSKPGVHVRTRSRYLASQKVNPVKE